MRMSYYRSILFITHFMTGSRTVDLSPVSLCVIPFCFDFSIFLSLFWRSSFHSRCLKLVSSIRYLFFSSIKRKDPQYKCADYWLTDVFWSVMMWIIVKVSVCVVLFYSMSKFSNLLSVISRSRKGSCLFCSISRVNLTGYQKMELWLSVRPKS